MPRRADLIPPKITKPLEGFSASSVFADHTAFSTQPGTFSLVWRQNSARARRIILAVGIILANFDAFEIARILGAVGVTVFHPFATGLGLFDTTLFVLFFFGVLLGPLLVISALRRERPGVATATGDALRVTRYGGGVEIPWQRIFDLQRFTASGDGTYRAVDDTGESNIAWPAHPLAWPGAVPHELGTLVTSEELAQIVATRIEVARQGNAAPN